MGTINQKDSISLLDIEIPFADAPVEDADIAALQAAIVAALPASLGQLIKDNSLSVTIASDQDAISVTIGATVTVTPDGGSFDVTFPSPQSVILDEPIDVTLDEPIAVTLDEPIDVNFVDTSGSYLIYRNLDLDEGGDVIKNSAGLVYGYFIYNNSASTRFIKFYNKATTPTVGTDTPVMTIPLPSYAAANVEFKGGIEFDTGIGIGATTGLVDADTGAPTSNDVIVNILYK